MCGGGKGSVSTQSSQQNAQQQASVAPPQEVLNQYRNVLSAATTAANTPFQSYGGQFVAPIGATQADAITNIISGAQNTFRPYEVAATNQYRYASDAAQPFNAFASALIPQALNASQPIGGEEINKYMSPYIQSVIDPTTKWLNQQNALQQGQLTSDLIGSGAFGGTKGYDAKAVLAGQQNLAEAPQIAGLYNQGYTGALGAAQQQQAQRVAALQQSANQALNIGNTAFGQGIQAGGAFTNLGDATLNARLQQGQAQLGAGTLEQQTQQGLNQALYNQWLMQQAYPFQTAQFEGNLAEGIGPLFGTNTTTSTQSQNFGTSYQPQTSFLSDDRIKEDVRTIGHTKDGLKIVRYRLKDDPQKLLRLGFLASDVEKHMPDAVSEHGGLKAVDYDRAARARGGLVAANDAGEGFARGGGYNPEGMAAILAAAQAMFPGAMGNPGIGSGPRGVQLAPPMRSALMLPRTDSPSAPNFKWATPPEPEMKQIADEARQVGDVGKGVSDLYHTGRDWTVGTPEVRDSSGKVTTPAGSGLFGVGGQWDSRNGIIGRNLPNSLYSNTAPVDTSTAWGGGADSYGGFSPDMGSARGGVVKRYASGGMPYGDVGLYGIDEEPLDPRKLVAQRNLSNLDIGSGSSGGSGSQAPQRGGSSVLGDIASGITGAAGLINAGSTIGGLFGGAGTAGAGAAATGAGASAAGSGTIADLLGLGFLAKRGGRIGYQEGGSPDDPLAAAVPPPPASVDDIPDFARRHAPESLPLPRRHEAAAVVPAAPVEEPDGGVSGVVPPGVVPLPAPDVTVRATPPAAQPAAAGLAPPLPGSSVVAPAPSVREVAQATPRSDAFNRAVDFTLGKEGGYNAHDANGAPVNYGINQAFNPDVNVAHLTRDQAKDIYHQRYWTAIGGDQLDPKIQQIAFDTAVVEGPAKAKEWLQASGGDPAKFMELRRQHEEGLAQSNPKTYGPYAKNWAQRRADLLGGVNATQTALNSGVALSGPAAGSSTTPQDKGFFDTGGWLDRNERYIIPALSFLGNMLASPSRTFAGAFGAGLAGGARSLMGQQELGQGQQRIDITQRGQLMSVWAQVSARIAALKAARMPGQPEPPELAQLIAQEAELRRQIMSTGVAPPGGTAGGASATPASGLAPASGNVPALNGSNPAPVPQPSPVVTPAPATTPSTTVPPARTSGTPAAPQQETPANKWWGNAPKPWVQGEVRPDYGSIRNNTEHPELNINPNNDPDVLNQKAMEISAYQPALAESLRQQATRAQQDLKEGRYITVSGAQAKVPGFDQFQQSQAQLADNQKWRSTAGDQQRQREATALQLDTIKNALETLHTGPLADTINSLAGKLNQLGIKVPSLGGLAEPDAFSVMLKSAMQQVYQGLAATGAPTDAKLEGILHGTPGPSMPPEANRHVLAQLIAMNEQQRAVTGDMLDEVTAYPGMARDVFQSKWQEKHPLAPDVDKTERDIAVMGGTPMTKGAEGVDIPDPRKLTVGQMYILPVKGKNIKARYLGENPDHTTNWDRPT